MPRPIVDLDSRLKRAIHDGVGDGVICGLFRTPTLEVVNRWVDVERLLRDVSTMEEAASVIHAKLVERAIPIPKGAVLVATDNTPFDFVRVLAGLLGVADVFRLFPEASKYEPPGLLDLEAGTPVIVCTDILLSANTARAAVSDLVRWGKDPVAAVAVVDARMPHGPLLDFLYRHIPIVSCTAVSIRAADDGTSKIEDIDPIQRKPINPPLENETEAYPITPEQLLNWCTEESSLYMGHIDRPVGRHYTGYIDARALISPGSESRRVIMSRIQEAVDRDHKQLADPSVQIEVWYPGTPWDPAYALARATSEALAPSSQGGSEPVGIPRRVGSRRFAFPSLLAAAGKPKHVVIVDWNSVTGTTLEQMMRLAAGSGAAGISAVALISQLPSVDEGWLREIRAISGQRSAGTLPTKLGSGRPIPVTVSFLTSLPLGYYPVSDCPVCQLRHEYSLLMSASPTQLLRRHADKRVRELQERDRASVLSSRPLDSYGVEVTAAEIAEVIQKRRRLKAALLDSRARLAVRTELRSASGSDATRQVQAAWVRLLATEPSWLRMPPLRFRDLRATVAQIAFRVATEHTDSNVRRQGIAVLRAASKRRFLSLLLELFLSARHDNSVLEEVLWAIFTSLRHPHLQTEDGLRHAEESLQQCEEALIFDRTRAPNEVPLSGQLQTWDHLRRSVRLDRKLASGPIIGSQTAWAALQAGYARELALPNSQLRSHGRDALLALKEWAREGDSSLEAWTKLLADIKECQDFISLSVLPYLAPLEDILTSEPYVASLNGEDLQRFLSLLGPQALMQIASVGELAADAARSPELVWNPLKRDALISEIQWWYEFFLNRGSPKALEGGPGLTFSTWVEDCPTDLVAALEVGLRYVQEKYRFAADQGPHTPDEALVFCDRRLVEDVVRGALMAAVDGQEPDPAGLTPHALYRLFLSDSSATLTITYPTGGEEASLSTLERLAISLRPFAADLRVRSSGGEDGSREVSLAFKRWTAAPTAI